MTLTVLDYYQRKPEFLPAHLQLMGLYVPPNGFAANMNPDEWEFKGPARHPTVRQLATVERLGYCLQELSANIDASKIYGGSTLTT